MLMEFGPYGVCQTLRLLNARRQFIRPGLGIT